MAIFSFASCLERSHTKSNLLKSRRRSYKNFSVRFSIQAKAHYYTNDLILQTEMSLSQYVILRTVQHLRKPYYISEIEMKCRQIALFKFFHEPVIPKVNYIDKTGHFHYWFQWNSFPANFEILHLTFITLL